MLVVSHSFCRFLSVSHAAVSLKTSVDYLVVLYLAFSTTSIPNGHFFNA